MQLYHIIYQGAKQKPILLLKLKAVDGYLHGLDSSKMTDSDKEKIRRKGYADIVWIKKYCRSSYDNAYRKLRIDKCKIIDTYEMKPLN
jgi:hypothetical protein